MRCTVCDYSDTTPSILNDGLTDGNSPRAFVERNDEVLCEHCVQALDEVELDWTQAEYDVEDHHESMIDLDFDRLYEPPVDKL